MATPFVRVLTSLAGGTPTLGARTVAGGQSVQLSLQTSETVKTVLWEILAGEPDWVAGAGWTSNGGRGFFCLTVGNALPPTFLLPSSPHWGKWLLRATVNGGLIGKVYDRRLIDSSASLNILGPLGIIDVAPFETTQFGGAGGWADQLQRTLRIIAANFGVVAAGGVLAGTSIPPAISLTGAVGDSTAFARANHTHPASLLGITAGENVTVTMSNGIATVNAAASGGGEGADLSSAPPAEIGAANVAGSSDEASRADHAHRGVHTLNGGVGDVAMVGAAGASVTTNTVAGVTTVTVGMSATTGTGVVHYEAGVRDAAASLVTDADLAGDIAPEKIAPSTVDGYAFLTVGGVAGWYELPSSGEATGLGSATPSAVGAASAVGTSVYGAHEDHSHAGVGSVNGVLGAALIAGAGSATASTSGQTITITTPSVSTVAPPAIGAAGSAGAAATLAKGDHTHAGVTSVNAVQGAVVLAGSATVAINRIEGTNTFQFTSSGTTSSGGGGEGAGLGSAVPAPVGATSSAGSSTSAAHEDHSHAGVASLNGVLGGVTLTGVNGTSITPNGDGTISVGPTAAPPTGTGFVPYASGTRAAAARLVLNADIDAAAGVALSKLAAGGTNGQVVTQVGGVLALANTFSPTGTGLAKVSGGAFVGAASLLVNADVSTTAAIDLSKLSAASGTDGQYVKRVSGVLQLADAPSGLTIPGSPSTLPLVSNGANGIATPRLLADADISSTANILPTKLAKSQANGQVVGTFNEGIGWAPPGEISRLVVTPTAAQSVNQALFTAPAFTSTGGIKYVITNVFCFISKSVVGDFIKVKVGSTAGGSDYLKLLTFAAGTANGQRCYGLSKANEMGTLFTSAEAIDRGYNYDMPPSAAIHAHVEAGPLLSAGEVVFIVVGFAAS